MVSIVVVTLLKTGQMNYSDIKNITLAVLMLRI